MSERTDIPRPEMIFLFADEDEPLVYDQPCRHALRMGGHSVYCQHATLGARKCWYRWMPKKDAMQCEGFEENPQHVDITPIAADMDDANAQEFEQP